MWWCCFEHRDDFDTYMISYTLGESHVTTTVIITCVIFWSGVSCTIHGVYRLLKSFGQMMGHNKLAPELQQFSLKKKSLESNGSQTLDFVQESLNCKHFTNAYGGSFKVSKTQSSKSYKNFNFSYSITITQPYMKIRHIFFCHSLIPWASPANNHETCNLRITSTLSCKLMQVLTLVYVLMKNHA